jgi:proton-coupled amino acid transporter
MTPCPCHPFYRKLLTLSALLQSITTNSGYCIFFAQQFAIVVDTLGGAELDKIVWIAIFFVILVPFTLVRNIGKLGFSTLIADLCIIVGLVYLYAYDIKTLVVNKDSPHALRLFNPEDFGIFIGTGMCKESTGICNLTCLDGYSCNCSVFPTCSCLLV